MPSVSNISAFRGRTYLANLLERLSPFSICDLCIADRVGLASHFEAAALVDNLCTTGGFDRFKGVCSICEINWLVLRLKSSEPSARRAFNHGI
jgi:hypothetical protein